MRHFETMLGRVPGMSMFRGFCFSERRRTELAEKRRCAVLVFLLFIPMTLATFISFAGRPQLPLEFKDERLIRTPTTDSLQQLYEWIIHSTPMKAVFICDPKEPIKMSGNVSELPAFTSRTLFVDSPTYLTAPYADRTLREHIAHMATNGQALSQRGNNILNHAESAIICYNLSC